MSSLPINVTLVGQGATNPAVPSYNLKGELKIHNGNLVFSSGDFVYQIPLEHIDSIYPYHSRESWGDEWRFLLCLFLSGVIFLATAGLGFIPLIWWLWWDYSPIEVQIIIKAWDEQHGLTATTVFSLGKRRQYREDAPEVTKEIWNLRGQYRQYENHKSQVIIRDN